MSLALVRASSQYGYNNNAVVTAFPFTFGCWFRADDVTNTQYLISIGDKDVDNSFWVIAFRGDQAGDPVDLFRGSGGSWGTDGRVDPKVTSGRWYLAVCVAAAIDDVKLYCMDQVASLTDSVAITNWDRVAVGTSADSTPSQFTGCLVGEAFVIDGTALTAGQVAALVAGGSVADLAPDAYWPLRDDDDDAAGSYDLTLVNSPSFSSTHVAQRAWATDVVSSTDWTGDETAVDEVTYNDTDYVTGDNDANGTIEFLLGDLIDPESSADHIIRIRARKSASAGHTRGVTVYLVEGSTVRATWVASSDLSDVWTEFSTTISTSDADSITDYADLRLRVTATGTVSIPPSSRRNVWVSWFELQVPAAPESADVTVTPAAVSGVGATVNPTVALGSVTVTPAAAAAGSATVAPTAVLGSVVVTATPAGAVGAVVDPTVQVTGGGTVVGPDPAGCVTTALDPAVALGSVLVTPAAASGVGAGVDPTAILGAVTVSPGSAGCVSAGVDPAVALGSVLVAPAAASGVGASVDPAAILGAVTVTPGSAGSVGAAVDPTVLVTGGGTVVGPDPAGCVTTALDPAVALGAVMVTPAAASGIGVVVDPATVLGSVTATPSPAGCVAVVVDPAVILGALALSPAAVVGIGAVAAPVVVLGDLLLTPAAAAAWAAGVDPGVQIAGGNVTFSPAAAVALAAAVNPTTLVTGVVFSQVGTVSGPGKAGTVGGPGRVGAVTGPGKAGTIGVN